MAEVAWSSLHAN